MLIATFGPSTGWVGKSITFENEQFLLEGYGPITAADVIEYDRQGHLVWASDVVLRWVGSRLPVNSAAPSQETAAPSKGQPSGDSGGAGNPAWCPYCGVILDPPPRGTRKCPVCREKIHLKRWPGEDTKRLMTEAQVQEANAAWDVYRLRNKAIRASENLGVSRAVFAREERALTESRHQTPPPGDVFWSLSKRVIIDAGKGRDWQRLKMAYWHQARWLYEEGRDPMQLSRLASEAELRGYAETGLVRRVEISDAGEKACPACRQNGGKVMRIGDALKQMPIPNTHCENGWCRCTWLPVI